MVKPGWALVRKLSRLQPGTPASLHAHLLQMRVVREARDDMQVSRRRGSRDQSLTALGAQAGAATAAKHFVRGGKVQRIIAPLCSALAASASRASIMQALAKRFVGRAAAYLSSKMNQVRTPVSHATGRRAAACKCRDAAHKCRGRLAVG